MSSRAATTDLAESSPTRAPYIAMANAVLAVSAVATGVSVFALGPTLGLVFALFGIATIVAPAFVVARGRGGEMFRAVLVTLAVCLPVLTALIWATFAGRAMTAFGLAQVAVVFVSYTAMLSFATAALGRVLPWGAVGGMVTLAGAAWLSWPVWTATWMNETLAATLIATHPLFAANAAGGFSPWPEHGVMYGMTRLGQDVPYAMPENPLLAIALNVAIILGSLGVAIFLSTSTATLAWVRRKRRVIKPL